MSYDIVVWDGEQPASNAAAGELVAGLLTKYLGAEAQETPTARIAGFVEAVLREWPVGDEGGPWASGEYASGKAVHFAVSYSRAEELTAGIGRLAEEHGLVCYDLNREILLGAGPQLTVLTENGEVEVPANWVSFSARELANPGRFVVVDTGASFAQAVNDAGVLVLEYRDGAHFQARGVPIDEVAEALREWSIGERGFVGRQVWTRLDEDG